MWIQALSRGDMILMRIKTDRHGLPMWRSWYLRIIALYFIFLHFCSHKHVLKSLKRFSLVVKDELGLIVYQTPMFHEYLF